MLETPNLKLKKPEDNDILDPSLSINHNMDVIDNEIGKIRDDMKNMSSDAAGTSYDNTNSKLTSTNVQGAIDEVNAKADANKISISEHETSIQSAKDDISRHSTEIESLKQSVGNGKTKVAKAITDQKVPTLATDSFDTMSSNISKIKRAQGNAQVGDVLKGKTFTNDAGGLLTGTLDKGKKWASGTVNPSNRKITVRGLQFKPALIVCTTNWGGKFAMESYLNFPMYPTPWVHAGAGGFYVRKEVGDELYNDGFSLDVAHVTTKYEWIAYE